MHNVRWSKLNRTPSGRTKSQREGIAFENTVAREYDLSSDGAWHSIQGPWIQYTHRSKIRYAQPDILLINIQAGRVLILECKLRHTTRALPQIEKYLRLLKQLFPYPLWKISAIEIYKFYDQIEFPNYLEQEWHPALLPPVSHCPWQGRPPRIIT